VRVRLGRNIACAPNGRCQQTRVSPPPVHAKVRLRIVVAVGDIYLIFVKVPVQILECTVVGAVLSAALESFLMCTLVRGGQLVVKLPVAVVAIVVIVMRKRGHGGYGQ